MPGNTCTGPVDSLLAEIVQFLFFFLFFFSMFSVFLKANYDFIAASI